MLIVYTEGLHGWLVSYIIKFWIVVNSYLSDCHDIQFIMLIILYWFINLRTDKKKETEWLLKLCFDRICGQLCI